MVFTFTLSPSISTPQIAPFTDPMPQEILPPSNAGPAAVEVTMILSLHPTPISPFVPRSMRRLGFSALSKPQESIPAEISAPT